MSTHNTHKAIITLVDATNDHNDDKMNSKVTCLNFIGRLYFAIGDHKQAGKIFEEAITLTQKFAHSESYKYERQLLKKMALTLHYMGRNKEAIACYIKAERLYPDNRIICKEECIYRIGIIYRSIDDHDNAMKTCKVGIRLLQKLNNPEKYKTFAYSHHNCGDSLRHMKRFEEAIVYYEKAAELYNEADDITAEEQTSKINVCHERIEELKGQLWTVVDTRRRRKKNRL